MTDYVMKLFSKLSAPPALIDTTVFFETTFLQTYDADPILHPDNCYELYHKNIKLTV